MSIGIVNKSSTDKVIGMELSNSIKIAVQIEKIVNENIPDANVNIPIQK